MKQSYTKFSIRLPDDMNAKLEDHCKRRRGVTKTAIVEAAVKDFLYPPEKESTEAVISRHLGRIDRKLQTIERDNEILGEALGLFIRVWLTNTMDLPADQKELAERTGGRRYKSYLKVLGERLQAGKCLFDDIPKEVLTGEDDFYDTDDEND